MCTTICTAAKPRMTRRGQCWLGEHLAHHQPERDGGQDHRQHEADHVALDGGVAAAAVVVVVAVVVVCVVSWLRSSQHSHQVDEGEDADPDDVQEVPEHRQAHQAARVLGRQAVLAHLDHQRDQPDDAEGDVQAVRADQREEGGQEGAALRAGAFVDQVRELVELEPRKPAPSRPVTPSQTSSVRLACRAASRASRSRR